MTVPDVFPQNGTAGTDSQTTNQWDTAPNLDAFAAAGERLSRMVAGNDHLVSEPGLVQALFQGNATPQQAQAIDQFLGGLKAEQAVRLAAQSGTKIPLSDEDKASLRAMGVNFDPVVQTYADAQSKLADTLAKQGRKFVPDLNGQPQVDAQGNVLTQPLDEPKKKKRGFFSRVAHDLTHNPVTSLVMDGTINTNAPNIAGTRGPGLKGLANDLQEGYQYVSTQVSTQLHAEAGAITDPTNASKVLNAQSAMFNVSDSDAALAKQLGYDPSSFFSMQAFKAKGYQHNDTTHLSDQWDRQNPQGLFGWDGKAAVTQAELFAANPEKYRQGIENDATLTPEQVAEKVKQISSDQFQTLVKQVGASRADFGADVANTLHIDPVKHPTLYQVTSTGANVLAQFFIDPIAVGTSLNRANAIRTTAVKSFGDAEGIRTVLDPTAIRSMAQANVQAYVHQMVDAGKAFRTADDAGKAAIQAHITASNPFAALLPDFLGTNQIIRPLTEAEMAAAKLGRHDVPFITGQGKPIESYEQAVDYFASKNALLRLQGGVAPVEARYMPGALSSAGYKATRGRLAAWSAGRQAAKSTDREAKFFKWATDPGRVDEQISKGMLARILPESNDAVDAATGKVIAGRAPAKATGLASAERGQLQLTDAGRGQIRRNMLDYGKAVAPESPVGKAVAWGTTGLAQRAALGVARFTNWLPRDTQINLLAADSGDSIRKAARTYMTSGDANMLAARWSLADAGERKAIVQGLKDQITHAAGLPRTTAGRKLIDQWKTQQERYATDESLAVKDANGVEQALHPGQVRETFSLPNFGRVHQASAKVGLWETTMGRALSSWGLNALLMQWKLGALATPVTAIRATIESWLAAAADHQFVNGLRAKAILREQSRLSGQDIARSRIVDKLANLSVLQGLGRFYRHVILTGVPEDFQAAIETLPDDLLHAYIHEQSALHYAMNVDPANVTDRVEAARAGFASKEIRWDSKEGFNSAIRNRVGYELTDELNGIRGANIYAHNLAIRVNRTPGVARAMLDHLDDPQAAPLDHVIDALSGEGARRLTEHTSFGKVYWRNDGMQVRAVTPAERDLGRQQWAERMTNDFKILVTGRNGRVNPKIADYIRTEGKAPEADWLLDNVKNLDRPDKMLAPMFEAVAPQTGKKAFVESILDSEGKGYQWLVERLIQRHTTTPLFAGAYADAKVGLEPYKANLIKGGMSAETAERAAANLAASTAWTRIARMVDDPAMKSQMDIAGRGFFSFSRATTMMLRRWADVAWRNPQNARRLMLAWEGAAQSGVVYKDENGQWDFHFPGSGVAQEVVAHAMSHIPGFEGAANLHGSDFVGHVATIIPGSNNPFQYSTTPMVSISGRWLASLPWFQNQREIFDAVDRKLNGTQGQGQGIVDTLVPNAVKKVKDVFDSDQRNSILASATLGALFNQYAAGNIPPEGASPAERDAWLRSLEHGVKSQLFLRSLLGLVSPATVGLPGNENEASKPDYAFAVSGSQGLRDEYKRLLADVHGDVGRATAIWTALHPDKTVYTESTSQSTVSKAVMPATQQALDWMQRNAGFISKYKSVAGYFIPEQSKGEPFSMAAYRAQLEMGLRERKTPAEFYNAVRVSTDGDTYFKMEDSFKAEIDRLKKAGESQLADARQQQWLDWSKQYKALHPIFATNLVAGSADRQAEANGQLADLKSMVKNGDVPDRSMAAGLSGMIQAYDGYKNFLAQHPGSTDAERAAKTEAFAELQTYMDGVIAAMPQLTDIYRGVFRTLNSNLAQVAYQ